MKKQNAYNQGKKGYSWGPQPPSSHPAQPTHFKSIPNMNGLYPNLNPQTTILEPRLPSILNPNSYPSHRLASSTKDLPPTTTLTDAELQAKIEKGHCFHCDTKFSPGHKCQNKRLQVLLVQEDHTEREIREPLENESVK